ncbi:hypothetical protein [Bacillus infantis]|uniref:hypothetical protein n=1 Tax=Bacillus infantis TaxID=324767 RepID=UPI002155EAD9|nr:hypothetical protein [Bacillus infantis]MCR6610597.1 hypothetical protein [Bacillus infantis]
MKKISIFDLFDIEVIKEGNRLLRNTAENIIERSRHTEGTYEGVKCKFNKPKALREAIKNKRKLYRSWLVQTKIYIDSGKDYKLRPVIDRINEKGSYYLYNMQVLSFSENSSKARKGKTVA